MPLPWVKYHWGVLDNDRFRRLSMGARLTYLVAIGYVGKLGTDGALSIEGCGPVTPADFINYTSLPMTKQRPALKELLDVGLLEISDAGTYSVSRWGEKAGEDSIRAGAAERQRKKRERDRHASVTKLSHPERDSHTVTRNENVTDKELDKELDSCAIAQPAPSSQAEPPKVTEPKLDVEGLEARRAILKAVWKLLEMTPFAATISYTEWAKRNVRAARDLADKGFTPEQIVTAWHSATTRLGSPARMMSIVQDELGRLAVPAKKPVAEKSGRLPDWKPSDDLPESERAANRARLGDLIRNRGAA